MALDIDTVKSDDIVYIDDVEIDGKKFKRMHVPVYDDSRYKTDDIVLTIDNLNRKISTTPKRRQTHMITENCYEESVGTITDKYGNEIPVLVCFYYIPTGAILDDSLVTYHFPPDKLDLSTDKIPEEYLTPDRVKAMMNVMQERAKYLEENSLQPIIIEKQSNSVVDTFSIKLDKRDIARQRFLDGNINEYVRKPLNPSSREYKDGKRITPKLFHYYLYSLIQAGLNDCPKNIRDNIPNYKPHRGRRGIQPSDYLFYLIDQVREDKPDWEYEGMMDTIVKSGYTSREWSTNALSEYASESALLPFLRYFLTYSALPIRNYENIFAVDATGFRCTTRNDFYGDKHHAKKENDWVDAHVIVGVNSNIAIALKVAHKYKVDELEAVEDLIVDAQKQFRFKYLLGDGGYMSDEKLNYYHDKYNVTLVFPIKRNTKINPSNASELWNQNLDANISEIWSDLYHPRSNVESTFASAKKSIGEVVYAKNENSRLAEVYFKFIVHNIKTLILYYSVAGVVPEWVKKEKIVELLRNGCS